MGIVNSILNLSIFFICYLLYFNLMDKTSEKREFNYWNIFSYFSILVFSIVSVVLLNYSYGTLSWWFVSFFLYSIIFYRNTLKKHIINSLIFYLIVYLCIYWVNILFDAAVSYLVNINPTYYNNLLIGILTSIASLLILFIITKQLLAKILIDDGKEFTNNQFSILLFPSIVGVISLYLFTNYPDDQNNLDISSILLALATVCVVFILVYLANIKTLHAKEKIESALREKEKFLKENMDIQYNFSHFTEI